MTRSGHAGEDRIRERAESLWEKAGRPAGGAEGFRDQARQELEGAHGSVLSDKERFGRTGAEEKMQHMGDSTTPPKR